MEWREWFPHEGDQSGLLTMAAKLELAAQVADELVIGVKGRKGAIEDAWQDAGQPLWSAGADGVLGRIAEIGRVSGDLAPVVRRYVADVQGLGDQWRAIGSRILGIKAHARLKGVRCVVDFERETFRCDWDTGSPHLPVEPTAVNTPETFYWQIHGEVEQIEALAERRRGLDAGLRDAMVGAVPAGWASQKAAFKAIGITRAEDMTPEAFGEAMATRAKGFMVDGLSAGEVEELSAFLAGYGADAGVMSEFFQFLGGAGTVGLVSGLDDQVYPGAVDPQVLLGLARQVRLGLSVASGGWPEWLAQTYARDLFTAVEENPGEHVRSLGFLFADPVGAPIGVELTVGLAELFDAHERSGGSPLTVRVTSSDAVGLADLDSVGGPVGVARYGDPAGLVLATLGTYPAQAAGFLDDPARGPERIEYWYADRDWADTGDGFAGPLALWDGAQRAPGGPGAGLDGYDPSTEKNSPADLAAKRSSRIMDALDRNETFQVESVSEQGAVHLAAVVAYDLPYLTEAMFHAREIYDQGQLRNVDSERESLVGTSTVVGLFGDGGTGRRVPVVGWDSYAALMGIAGSQPGGAAVLSAAADRYAAALRALAGDNPVLVGEAHARGVELAGFVAGAVDKARIDAGARLDAQVRAQIDTVVDLITSAPLPGLGSTLVKGAAGVMIDGIQLYTVGQLAGAGGEAFATDHEETERLRARTEENTAQSQMHRDLLANAMGDLGIEGPVPAYDTTEGSAWTLMWDQVVQQQSGRSQTLNDIAGEWETSYGFGQRQNAPDGRPEN